MKKLFFMATCFALTQLSYAQSPVGQDVWIDIGESETVQLLDLDAGSFDSGATGTNVSWNFSDLPLDTDVCMYEAMPMNLSPFQDRYPNADMFYVCEISVGGTERAEVHTFYSKAGNTVSFEGTATISINVSEFDSIFLQYMNPLTFLQFPITYQDSYTDDYTGTLTTFADQNIVIEIEGTATSTVDSYGSLITPAGTFDDCLRIKRTEMETVMVQGIPVLTEQESHRYTWTSANENYLLLNMDSLVTKDFLGNTVATTYAGMYRSRGPSTSTFDVNKLIQDIKVFPNPIQNWVNIEFPSRINFPSEFIITDMQGKVFVHTNTNKSNRLQLDMSQFPQGTYILHFNIEGGRNKMSLPLFKM